VDVWGEKHTVGVGYLTAQLLAKSPQAMAMKLVSKDGSTVYDEPLMTMKRSVTAGFRNT
jgi:hypothetical protein